MLLNEKKRSFWSFNENDKNTESLDLLEITKTVSLHSSIFIIFFGLIGHFLTLLIFSQRRFRNNSTNIYALILSIVDSLFLLIHFFEDTLRIFRDIYFETLEDFNSQFYSFITTLNIIDRFDSVCFTFHYLRYVLRFISAYIICCFTIQRLTNIYRPLKRHFKSKKLAWKTVGTIIIISLIVNFWVLFFFEINNEGTIKYCDVKKERAKEYFHITHAYTFMIILLPISIIFVCNTIIIAKSCSLNKKPIFQNKIKKVHFKMNRSNRQTINQKLSHMELNQRNTKLRPFFLNMDQLINKKKLNVNNTKMLAKNLIIISFTYACCNLPFLISWIFYYYDTEYNKNSSDYLYSIVKICEIFYLLNYGINFYVSFAFGSIFRRMIKYTSKKLFSINISFNN